MERPQRHDNGVKKQLTVLLWLTLASTSRLIGNRIRGKVEVCQESGSMQERNQDLPRRI
jgi:hypothetical protein